MNLQRRNMMRMGVTALGLMATTALWPLRALAAAAGLDGAFKADSVDAVFKDLGSTPTESADIDLQTPDIAENGAVVPVSVTSKIPNTDQIMILVEKNPNPLAASFDFAEGTEGAISTRVKIGQTCDVYAVVRADGKFYSARRETKVTLGGCGG
ncbi:thiosulfate oxidation carrier protein SoxY [Polycyclovorans algicola]|uniref:thiosulfate oxidation carrier protein SoxY n=1 Tax=Polycyclovorans algicola TaxID=616992 RepID=UPI0004A6FF69|nr:thiosulfate oxidation carrier protein SoxY [Polycyclovorans algicola]